MNLENTSNEFFAQITEEVRVMVDKLGAVKVLKQVDVLERELAGLKRDILHSLVVKAQPKKLKISLFGSVCGGDVTDGIIEEAKGNLFRNL